jgi:glycerol-3-phosphate dehydrogenase
MTPLYAWWEVPYYWAGLKAYDAVAALGAGGLHWSRYEAPGAARAAFPTLAARRAGDGRSLKGTVSARARVWV